MALFKKYPGKAGIPKQKLPDGFRVEGSNGSSAVGLVGELGNASDKLLTSDGLERRSGAEPKFLNPSRRKDP